MLKVRFSNQFKKDFKRAKKQGKNMDKLQNILKALASEESLEKTNMDHALIGNWKSFRECHIEPNWLLIYRINKDVLELVAQRIGTHAELFTS